MSKFQRIIAAALAATNPATHTPFEAMEYHQWRKDRDAIVQALQQDNPRFDKNKFIAACVRD